MPARETPGAWSNLDKEKHDLSTGGFGERSTNILPYLETFPQVGSNNTSNKQTDIDAIVQHVEAATRDAMNALNNRDLNIDSPAWRNVADDVTIRSSHLVAQTSDGDSGLQRHLDSIADTVAIYPDYKMYISELHTEVSTRRIHATVFANLETHGNPPGVVMQGVIIYRFSETGGRWMCMRIESVRGI